MWRPDEVRLDGVKLDQSSWLEALEKFSNGDCFAMFQNHHLALKSSRLRGKICEGAKVFSIDGSEVILAPSTLLLEALSFQPEVIIQSGDPGSGKSMANAWISEELMKRLPKCEAIVTGDPNGIIPARPGWWRVSESWICPRQSWGPPVVVLHDELPPSVRAGRDGSDEVRAMNAAIDTRRHGNVWYLINTIGSSSAAASIRRKALIIDRFSTGGILAQRCAELERAKMKEVAALYRTALQSLDVSEGLAMLRFPARHKKRGAWLSLLRFPLLEWYDERHEAAREGDTAEATISTAAPYHAAGPPGREDLESPFIAEAQTKSDEMIDKEVEKRTKLKLIQACRDNLGLSWGEVGKALGSSGDSARKFWNRHKPPVRVE